MKSNTTKRDIDYLKYDIYFDAVSIYLELKV